MEKLIAISSARNADIFLRRNTLAPYENTPHTLDDIAVHCGVTRERVRQIVESLWRRLRLGNKNFTEVELRRVQQALLLLPELEL